MKMVIAGRSRTVAQLLKSQGGKEKGTQKREPISILASFNKEISREKEFVHKLNMPSKT